MDMPRRLYRAEQVRELDRRFIEDIGVPGFDLMHRAAKAAFKAIQARWPARQNWVILAGPGNNGGDGLLVGALAARAGYSVTLFYLADPEKAREDAARALEVYRNSGAPLHCSLQEFPEHTDVIVDALLGTGLARPLEGVFLEAVGQINAFESPACAVAAVDIPTGLDADTGRVWGASVKAHITPTFIGAKLGLYTGEGPAQAGEVMFEDLGAPEAIRDGLPVAATALESADRLPWLGPRSRSAHKGRFGHVLCVGGNYGMSGAVRLAGEAALRSGAGLGSIASRAEHAAVITQARPELMCRSVEEARELGPMLKAASVVAIGPGLGQDAWARSLFDAVLNRDLPLVVDADALNMLAADPVERGNWILTPHPGEAARLLGTDTAAVQADRPEALRELCRRYDATVILKGAGTLISSPDGPVWLNATGNPGMAVGGMGDLLTGIAAGLLAQLNDAPLAARLAAWIHGQSGDLASRAGERGLLPSDLLPQLRTLVNP